MISHKKQPRLLPDAHVNFERPAQIKFNLEVMMGSLYFYSILFSFYISHDDIMTLRSVTHRFTSQWHSNAEYWYFFCCPSELSV